MVKKSSEGFRTVRKQKTKPSEEFGTIPSLSEKTAEHTLTVREATKMFENRGVARTERAILSWCYPNKQGITKLNCYFDPVERKWYITPSSVETAIKEEQNRQQNRAETPAAPEPQKPSEEGGTASERFRTGQETFRTLPNAAERKPEDLLAARLGEFERKNRDLEISNRVKDRFIDLLKNKQQDLIKQLTDKSHRIGELETELRLLQAPDKARFKKTFDVKPETQDEIKHEANGKEGGDEGNQADVETKNDVEPIEENETKTESD